MFVFFLEIIVAFFFCKALRGGRPGGIFEKSEDDEGENFFLFFLVLNFFLFFFVSSNRLKISGQTFKKKYALKLSFFGF